MFKTWLDIYYPVTTRQESTIALCVLAVRQPLSSVCLSGQILLTRYLMNGLSDFSETYPPIHV